MEGRAGDRRYELPSTSGFYEDDQRHHISLSFSLSTRVGCSKQAPPDFERDGVHYCVAPKDTRELDQTNVGMYRLFHGSWRTLNRCIPIHNPLLSNHTTNYGTPSLLPINSLDISAPDQFLPLSGGCRRSTNPARIQGDLSRRKTDERAGGANECARNGDARENDERER